MPTISLIQIDNYGPWTVTPHPRRETDLQKLQAGIYSDISSIYTQKDSLLFFNRFDNMVGVTNTMSHRDHRYIQETIQSNYPVTISIANATDANPGKALGMATKKLQNKGSAQDSSRRSHLIRDGEASKGVTQIAHFDVVDFTETHTDRLNEFRNNLEIQRIYLELMEYMYDRHGALTYYVGGDNFISVCNCVSTDELGEAIESVEEKTETKLKVGLGESSNPADASMNAKHALEECRENDAKVRLTHQSTR